MRATVTTALALFFWAGTALAQRLPHLAYVYPAGGRLGTTFEVTVGGQALAMVSNACVTGSGIDAALVEFSRPMNQKEFNSLRERFKELEDKFQATRKDSSANNVWSMADTAELDRLRTRLIKSPPNRALNPAMADSIVLKLSIATNASPGEQEIRLVASNGLSNPLRFYIGTLPEQAKPAAKPASAELDRFLARLTGKPMPVGTPKYEAQVTLPVVLNGQIMPGGVDRYRFFARAGQQLVIVAKARELIPFLADAVPGWFEAVLSIYDSRGNELSTRQRFRSHPDPVIHFEVPRDGEYTVELHDAVFRGRQDFVYRLAIGQLPFVSSIFPLGGRAGEPTTLTLTGWNLAEKSASMENTNSAVGITAVNGPFINSLPFMVDELPECLERKPNHSRENAQPVSVPVLVNGCISAPGDRAVFQFPGRANQQIVAEVCARRLDSPLDSFLRLTDAAGAQLAFNDDFEDKGSGLNTHHADSYLSASLPADGVYLLELGDTQGKGGPDFAYRLRLSEPSPDFALRLTPSSLTARAGLSVPLTAWALRHDGFTNAIDLVLENAPAGFSLSGARILAGLDKAQITLRAPFQPTDGPVSIRIAGQARIGGKPVRHLAVPCEDMMQAFAYRHLVPSKELVVLVNGQLRSFARDAFKILSATPVKISPGGTADVVVSTPSGAFLDRFDVELENAPEGISLQKASMVEKGIELVIACDAAKARSGMTNCNLICSVLPKRRQSSSDQQPARRPIQRTAAGTFPAIALEVTQ